MTLLEKAYTFAKEKHEGQFRRDGVTPYFTHCEKVASLLDGELEKAVAYLHDTVEDERCNINEIELVFGEQIAGFINVLTKIKDWTYERYIERFNYPANRRMKLIKIADIVANLSDNPTKKQIEKYNKALRILANV